MVSQFSISPQKFKRIKLISKLSVAVALVTFLSPFSYAADAETVTPAVVENNPDSSPDVLVSKASDSLLAKINEATAEDRALGLPFYEHIVEETVGPFVDFETIASRIMGRDVYDKASDDQRAAFVEAFKQSLIKTYAKGISTYDNQTVTVSPFDGVATKNGVSRARVEVVIKPKGGKPFPIVYSMFKDKAKGWMLENMHLDGVNVGSTFRNQFKQSMLDHKNDLDQVIQSWGASS